MHRLLLQVTIHTMDFSPTGHRLAFGSRDSCTILVYDTALPPTHREVCVRVRLPVGFPIFSSSDSVALQSALR